jgi:hypothetical protein
VPQWHTYTPIFGLPLFVATIRCSSFMGDKFGKTDT